MKNSNNNLPVSRARVREFLEGSPTEKQLRTRASAMEKMAMEFEGGLVPWPALAQSFWEDANLVRSRMKTQLIARGSRSETLKSPTLRKRKGARKPYNFSPITTPEMP